MHLQLIQEHDERFELTEPQLDLLYCKVCNTKHNKVTRLAVTGVSARSRTNSKVVPTNLNASQANIMWACLYRGPLGPTGARTWIRSRAFAAFVKQLPQKEEKLCSRSFELGSLKGIASVEWQ